MSDDRYLHATRALRESLDGTSADADATYWRLLVSARKRTTRRRNVAFAVAPLAAAFLASAAWGAATGRLTRWSEALSRTGIVGSAHDVAGSGVAAAHVPQFEGHAEPPSMDVKASIAPEAPAIAVVASELPTVEAPTTRPTTRHEGAVNVAAHPHAANPALETETASEQALYGVAHRAHFAARDASQALHGWDAYLARYPEGQFAPEARYNRALALLRLGDAAAARRALAPFAMGSLGGYRQADAQRLLDAMDPSTRGPR